MKQIKLTKEPLKTFPTNPFPDVQPTEFHKMNKKQVTEDYVSENFKFMGWKVYKPFVDTGIDRVMTKEVCPNGHTCHDESLENSHKCPICKSRSLTIVRYVQVKTRELKGEKSEVFGFTLKTKDFRLDPRHFLILYSDHTNDFLIISILQYLKFFFDHDIDSHASPTFKQGNGKINSWKIDEEKNEWYFATRKGRFSWEMYRNINGLKNMQNPEIDLKLKEFTEEAKQLRNTLFRKLTRGRTFSQEQVERINEYLAQRDFSSKHVKETRSNTIQQMSDLPDELKSSIMNYWRKYQGLVLE